METVKIYNKDKSYDITLIVADNEEELKNVISLNDINNEKKQVSLEDDKVVLSQKLSKLLDVKIGESVTFKDSKDNEYCLEVKAEVENYINNFAYLTKSTYEKIFGTYEVNSILITTPDLSSKNQEALNQELLGFDSVANIVSSEDSAKKITDVTGSLDSVVVILIVASALLDFVVMYNLSNINICERQREIATLKVLGFFDKEVDNYITKENILLTIIGIAIGLIAGVYLGNFMIKTCEIDALMFVRHVNNVSYLYSAIITIFFTIIVNIITHINLKKINMIDSLKSVE
jgi:putative ABC transport system permease protein